MPWKEESVMDQKEKFVIRSLDPEENFTQLCSEFGISTKTGYKWKERFIQGGRPALKELSRRPHKSPTRTDEDTICEIIKIRTKKPSWGSQKILKVFLRNHPDNPNGISRSTVDRILDKAGLSIPKKKRRKPTGERLQKRITPEAPNDVWTVDFKGWWYTSKKEKCEPLTVRDEYSKFIFSVKILEKGDITCVKHEFEHLFAQYGLPKVIRSDNGPPFAHAFSMLGLTKLSAWWLYLGIHLDRIDPGKPYQNGGHERMHKDIKRELQGKINGPLSLHQAIFDQWREEFNTERPHEALDFKCPADIYEPSKRRYRAEEYDYIYPPEYRTRKVNNRGWINFQQERYYISTTMMGFSVGVKWESESELTVRLNNFDLGKIDLHTKLFEATLDKDQSIQNNTLPIS